MEARGMIVDLHTHYPMHFKESSAITPPPQDTPGDWMRAILLDLANRLANFPDGAKPAITIENLKNSPVRVALSTLYLPFDEIDLSKQPNAPPGADYFEDLETLLDAVENDVRTREDAVIVHNRKELEEALETGKVILIHAVEGGFHIGDTPDAVRANVARAADRGVACITVAHLFFRQIATNAPAIPFMSDAVYNELFPQKPSDTVMELGEALVRAMAKHHVLIDITHMTHRAIDATLALLDRIEKETGATTRIPVVATHAACQFGKSEYTIADAHIKAVAERNGVIGLIACSHWMADGLEAPTCLDESLTLIDKHIDRIFRLTGSHRFTAIGSDMDGFIKPALPGLNLPRDYENVAAHLQDKYGADAERICSGNALRLLKEYWWGNRPQ
jgi:microsomal dipeptidase-like Zn-dependent dipeptidase